MILFLALGGAPSDSDARAALALAAACNDSQPAHSHHAYEWRRSDQNPRYLLLYDNGKLIGCYNTAISNYWSWNAMRGEYEVLPSKLPTELPMLPQQSYTQPLYLQPFVQGPQFFPQGGAYCPPGASS